MKLSSPKMGGRPHSLHLHGLKLTIKNFLICFLKLIRTNHLHQSNSNCHTCTQTAANQDGMVANMVRLANSKTSERVDFIKQFQTNKSDPKLEQSLDDCTELFVDAVSQLSNAETKALDKSYSDVKLFSGTAKGDIEACELALRNVESSEALFPSLVEKDTPVQQHISNAMAIASHSSAMLWQ